MTTWIVIALAGILIEMVSTQLIAIWFTVASVISAIMLYCGVATKWQWIQFLVTGIVLALLFHPFAKQILKHVKYTPLNTPETIAGKLEKLLNPIKMAIVPKSQMIIGRLLLMTNCKLAIP